LFVATICIIFIAYLEISFEESNQKPLPTASLG